MVGRCSGFRTVEYLLYLEVCRCNWNNHIFHVFIKNRKSHAFIHSLMTKTLVSKKSFHKLRSNWEIIQTYFERTLWAMWTLFHRFNFVSVVIGVIIKCRVCVGLSCFLSWTVILKPLIPFIFGRWVYIGLRVTSALW